MNMSEFYIDLKKSFPTLERAPIVEAVIQWKAVPSVELQEEALRNQLATAFQEYGIERQRDIHAIFKESPSGSEMGHSWIWQGFRLTKLSGDKPEFVAQFTRKGLVFSQLAPYRNWEGFIGEANRFWSEFRDVCRPTQIDGISTRFISQVLVSNADEAGEYIEVAAQPLKQIGISTSNFFHQDKAELRGVPYNVTLVRAVQAGKDADRSLLIVDIDVSTREPLVEFDAAEQTLRELRFIKNEIFFTVMKMAREKFGGLST
ncbi:MAG: TIGR04255 family protein [Planctomycetaceae bacterium]|nr:TIGR04255 family protein [Planctomycetaceae bacterium]MCB9951108.1 TIGR04255 family protein [Planctomycetaceae bacterium]